MSGKANETTLKRQLQNVLGASKLNYQQVIELASEIVKNDPENLRFSVDAGTLLNLGRDSIKDHSTAVIELVKNGYDADATKIEVDIITKRKPYIRIADNGNGMSELDVLSKWLRIGFSEKKQSKISGKRRRKTGEKGIGRLSADRLGSILQLVTRKGSSEIFGLEVNWDDFNRPGTDLATVKIKKIKATKINIPKGVKSTNKTGTELIITGLRNSWTDSDLKSLWTELSILTPPFKKVKDFEIYINSDLESEFLGKVESNAEQAAEVDLSLKFDNNSSFIKYTIKNKYHLAEQINQKIKWKDLIGYVKDIKRKHIKETLQCGPVEIRLLFYPRDSSMIKGTDFKLRELQQYLDENSGVKIYRDNISVKPYGVPNLEGNDWLDLSLRQGQNPAGIGRPDWMLKPNQIIGAIFISRDKNAKLKDSSAREGFVHEDAFYDLRSLTLAAIRLLEVHRHNIYKNNDVEKPPKPSTAKLLSEYKEEISKLKDELENLKSQLSTSRLYRDTSNQIQVVIDKTDDTQKSIDELLNKNRTLSGLATVGIASTVFGHETQISISQMKTAIGNAILFLETHPPDTQSAKKKIEQSLNYADAVLSWGHFALSRIRKEKRRKKHGNISEVITRIINEIKPTIEVVGISLTTKLDEVSTHFYVMDIESIVLNLLTNAYSACLQKTSKRQIRIELNSAKRDSVDGYEIVVADSGNGVPDNLRAIIWEPFYTTKTNEKGKEAGTGLGLTVVDSIVEDLEGTRHVENDSILKGAKFTIWIPKN